MLLHGHTTKSIDEEIHPKDVALIYSAASAGVVGPVVQGLSTYRILSHISMLQAIVSSALGGPKLPPLKVQEAAPEIASMLEVKEEQQLKEKPVSHEDAVADVAKLLGIK